MFPNDKVQYYCLKLFPQCFILCFPFYAVNETKQDTEDKERYKTQHLLFNNLNVIQMGILDYWCLMTLSERRKNTRTLNAN